MKRNWARGAPPPASSWEWSGIPQSAAVAMAGEGREEKRRVAVKAEAGGAQKSSSSPWPFAIGGFVAGLLLGSWGND
jgi:hypothetical protein